MLKLGIMDRRAGLSSVFARLENNFCSSSSDGGIAGLTGNCEDCESAVEFDLASHFFLVSGAAKSISKMGTNLTFFMHGESHIQGSDVHDMSRLYLICASRVNRSAANLTRACHTHTMCC